MLEMISNRGLMDLGGLREFDYMDLIWRIEQIYDEYQSQILIAKSIKSLNLRLSFVYWMVWV
jgi:hypothetical protein